MKKNFIHKLRVRFNEVDSHGHVYNGNYLTYFNVAINEYCRQYDLLNKDFFENQSPVFYVAETSTRYYKPLFFDQMIDISVSASVFQGTKLEFSLNIFLEGEPRCVAEGKVFWVHINPLSKKKFLLPQKFIKKLENIESN